ncbi:hypothetical protein [Nostoc sp.]|uniref:hypothetical protein n=1 Tax=Nostoc sp. TaxID=1180 RepID=UPI003FA55D05
MRRNSQLRILKGGAAESIMQRALQILRADEQLSQLETIIVVSWYFAWLFFLPSY